MRKISTCLILLLLSVFITPGVFAQSRPDLPVVGENQISEALGKIVPVRFYYPNPLGILVYLKEAVNLFFQPSAVKKSEFDMTLAGKRLKESYLLLLRNDVNNSSKDLKAYSEKSDEMVRQLEKARSQNQDVENLIGTIAENLKLQETMLGAISQKGHVDDSYSFKTNLDTAVTSHKKAIMALDNIRPGIKDRFTSTKEATPEALPSPSPSPQVKESTPSVRPRRIIY